MSEAVLTVNAGSSSLKFGVYERGQPHAAITGQIEGLEPGGTPVLKLAGQAPEGLEAQPGQAGGHEGAFEMALRRLAALLGARARPVRLRAVAHRIVHGGERYTGAVRVDAEVMQALQALEPLAPLHQPHNLAGVRAFARAYPDLPQIACFDTAFHATLPEVERRFALPALPALAGVRRYGFHGLSYQYLTQVMGERSPRMAGGRALMAHLGNGASVCAVREGHSVATSMGFSALDGLMMGTRSGSLDAGVLLHLLRQGWTADQLEDLLYKRSGLKGVSGLSADMRTLRASQDERAQQAIALFTHRVLRESGAMVAVLGGLDVLVFTGGIGEHDGVLRQAVCQGLAHLGVVLDDAANARATGDDILPIHAPDSAAEVWVVPTDEGRVAAGQAWSLLEG